MELNNYEKAKVELIGLTDKHIQILLQTIADIGSEKYAPNIKAIPKIKEK